MAAGATGQPYSILSREKTEELTPDGRFVDVYRVSFQLADGSTDFVRVPAATYSPAAVDAEIRRLIAEHDELNRLAGGAAPPPAEELG